MVIPENIHSSSIVQTEQAIFRDIYVVGNVYLLILYDKFAELNVQYPANKM